MCNVTRIFDMPLQAFVYHAESEFGTCRYVIEFQLKCSWVEWSVELRKSSFQVVPYPACYFSQKEMKISKRIVGKIKAFVLDARQVGDHRKIWNKLFPILLVCKMKQQVMHATIMALHRETYCDLNPQTLPSKLLREVASSGAAACILYHHFISTVLESWVKNRTWLKVKTECSIGAVVTEKIQFATVWHCAA